MNEIIRPRHGIPGYFALADLPQRAPISETALSTGYIELDPLLRIYPGQLIVITGEAGSGKSTFALNLISNLAYKHGLRSWMYIPENEANILQKMELIYSLTPLHFGSFAHTKCFVQSSNYEHYDDAPRTIEWILEMAYRAWEIDKISVVMVDPWNELERARMRDEALTDYIGRCLMRMKMFAKETGCTMIIIAHPTKEANDKEVALHHIEGSMNWKNKADNGIIVKRDGGRARVISAKVREQPFAGKRGSCLFTVDPESGLFTEIPDSCEVIA